MIKKTTAAEIAKLKAKKRTFISIIKAPLEIIDRGTTILEIKEYRDKNNTRRWRCLEERACCGSKMWTESNEIMRRIMMARVPTKTCKLCRGVKNKKTRLRELAGLKVQYKKTWLDVDHTSPIDQMPITKVTWKRFPL